MRPNRASLLIHSVCFITMSVSVALASSPRLVAISPVDGARRVRPGTTILLRYDQVAGISTSALQGLVTVTGSTSGAHPGRLHASREGDALLFEPDAPFALGEHVTVSVSPQAAPDRGVLPPSRVFSFDVSRRIPDPRPVSDFTALPQLPVRSATPATARPFAAFDTLPPDFPQPVIQKTGVTESGYLFVSNLYIAGSGTNYLMIFDDGGSPVWYRAMPATCVDFKRQGDGTYTYYDYSLGSFTVLDSTMAIIDHWACGNGYSTDQHELRLLPNGHALMLSYDPEIVDMSTVVPGGDTAAVVVGLIVQELDADRNVVFQWRSWDHFQITDCLGIDLTSAFIDCVHGNAIEVDADGNLLISSRHLSEITKLDRTTGDVIWRWGGLHNQFTFVGDTLTFSYQHAIRRIANGHYTLFDNGDMHAWAYSRACEYALDPVNMTATLTWSYRDSPDDYGYAMGYVQRLDDGNTLVAYGMGKPDAIEVDPAGNKLLQLTLPTGEASYRVVRAAWPGPVNTAVGLERQPDLEFLGPNPSHGSTTLLARLPVAGTADVVVYDVQGRVMATPLPRQSRAAGVLSLPLSLAGHPSGVYFARLESAGRSITRRLLVIE